MDFGTAGLADTLAARVDAPVRIVGIGANEEEPFAPAAAPSTG